MAHLRSIVQQCRVYGCTTRASEALYSFRNELVGGYCKKHATAALRDRQRVEDAYFVQMKKNDA